MTDFASFEHGKLHIQSSGWGNSNATLRIVPSKRETPPQRYEPDEDHPCGAVAPVEYSDGRLPPRCVLDADHKTWHATEPAPPPYDNYPAIQWAREMPPPAEPFPSDDVMFSGGYTDYPLS